MAAGDVKHYGNVKKAICLLTAQATNNSPPATAGAGFPTYPETNEFGASAYASKAEKAALFPVRNPLKSTLCIRSSAGSGTMTGTFTLWGYLTAAAAWFPIKVNGGNAIAETGTDVIGYTEAFENIGHFDRVYCELSAVGGTSTAFEAWLVTAKESV